MEDPRVHNILSFIQKELDQAEQSKASETLESGDTIPAQPHQEKLARLRAAEAAMALAAALLDADDPAAIPLEQALDSFRTR